MRPFLVLALSIPGLSFVLSPASQQRTHNVIFKPSRVWTPLGNSMPTTTTIAYNTLLDNLMADAPKPVSAEEAAAYEEGLGKLVFGSGDPTLDIAKDLDLYDEGFSAWLLAKTDATMDLEERSGLRDLLELVDNVRQSILEKALEQQESGDGPADVILDVDASDVAAPGATAVASAPVVGSSIEEAGDDTAVLQQMLNVQMAGDTKALEEQEEQRRVEAEALAREQEAAAKNTYLILLAEFLACPDADLPALVLEKYAGCSLEFFQTAKEAANDGGGSDGAKIERIIELVNEEASRQVQTATENLQMVLTSGPPQAMETSIVKLGNQNQLSETFLLLLKANIDQAQAAGAKEPAEVMERLLTRARLVLDNKKSPAQKLLSELLRTESRETRIEILEKAFTPHEQIFLSATDDASEPMPDVNPPDFIEAAKGIIRNFGNMEIEKGVTVIERVTKCVAEAEQVSTSIYGESMTAEEQQDRMWKDGTISIWDLETLEQQAEIQGEQMPWHQDVDESKFMDGFNKKGQKLIGG